MFKIFEKLKKVEKCSKFLKSLKKFKKIENVQHFVIILKNVNKCALKKYNFHPVHKN